MRVVDGPILTRPSFVLCFSSPFRYAVAPLCVLFPGVPPTATSRQFSMSQKYEFVFVNRNRYSCAVVVRP